MTESSRELTYAYIAFSFLSPKTVRKLITLIASLGGIEPLMSMSPGILSKNSGISLPSSRKILTFLGDYEKRGKSVEKKIAELGGNIIVYSDPAYPEILKTIPDPPMVLFYKGDLSVLSSKCVAVVGSRALDPYGRELSFSIAKYLAENGVTVVSGLARGIDGYAHRGALAGRGKTIACLGTGLDVRYPREHSKLFDEVTENGLVITEFLPTTPPLARNFPVRNRIIAGLSLGTVVVRAALKSGSLLTAHLALSYGREVMALPGSVLSPLSAGTNALIKDGAHLIRNGEDVLNLLNILPSYTYTGDGKDLLKEGLSERELKILSFVDGSRTAADIAELSDMSSASVYSVLSILEFKDLVKQSIMGIYIPCGKL